MQRGSFGESVPVSRWSIARIALRRSAIGPLHHRVDLRCGQAHAVREPAVVGISKPWRHFAAADGVSDRVHARACVLVGQQRKRAGFTGTMADLAIPLEDGRDVPRVGGDIHARKGSGRAGDLRRARGDRRPRPLPPKSSPPVANDSPITASQASTWSREQARVATQKRIFPPSCTCRIVPADVMRPKEVAKGTPNVEPGLP